MSDTPRDGAAPVIGRAGRRRQGQTSDRGRQPRKRRAGRWLPTLLLLLLLGASATVAVAVWALAPVDPGSRTVLTFEVPRGRSATGVAQDLQEAGLLRDHRALLAYLMWQGWQARVGEGLYDLSPALSVQELAQRLVEGGRPRTARLLLPEGQRARDLVVRVQEAGWSAEVAAELEAIIANPPPELRPSHLPDDAGLEGYLFPDSYDLPLSFGAADILRSLTARFQLELDEATRDALVAAELPIHDWVVLASMVQAEAGAQDEMGIIAGVFLNRLDLGMPLQSDPTVAYGLGKELPELDFPGGDFAVDHPWNTYTRGGLPEGPIGNPGAAALAAVLAPERQDAQGRAWYYFLHGVDQGRPVFRPNLSYEAHLQDVARFLR